MPQQDGQQRANRTNAPKEAGMRVKTFGALRFEDQYGRERFLETRKTAALAAFLAVQPGKRFRREVLADLLWGGKDDSSARHSLSQAVCLIRRNLGSGLLEGHPQYLSIPHGAAGVDAIELSALMEGPATRDDLEAVERLYGGDFLDGLDVCQEDFDIWIRSEETGCVSSCSRLWETCWH